MFMLWDFVRRDFVLKKQQSTENTNSNCIGLAIVYACVICLPMVTPIG